MLYFPLGRAQAVSTLNLGKKKKIASWRFSYRLRSLLFVLTCDMITAVILSSFSVQHSDCLFSLC